MGLPVSIFSRQTLIFARRNDQKMTMTIITTMDTARAIRLGSTSHYCNRYMTSAVHMNGVLFQEFRSKCINPINVQSVTSLVFVHPK